jgi:NDP-4-keto-2,6-dideoxyhexose 3-C-methyltransferase
MIYKLAANCRSCAGELTTVLDLGSMHINAFLKPGEPDTEKAPLTLAVCKKCMLVQLRHTVQPDLLFRNFWYRSSVTNTMRAALADLVAAAKEQVPLRPNDVVVDIGSNDGTLLRCWPDGVEKIGFDPAENLAEEASEGGNTIITDYFTSMKYYKVTQRKAKIITCAACLYDIEKINFFLFGVMACLDPEGVFVAQVSYLPAMLDTNDFACAVHEHIFYFSLTSLLPLMARNGLHVYDVEFNNINGGSVRVFADHGIRPPSSRVHVALQAESKSKLASFRAYQDFSQRVKDDRDRALNLLRKFKADGPIYLLGASTKGQIVAQYYGLTKDLIDGASDRDGRKYGLEMVGNRIPIVSEEAARAAAKTFFVNIWPFAAEVRAREADWLEAGGRLVFAQPKVYVVEGKHG